MTTVRKWRRKYQRAGRAGLTSCMGRPKTGPLGKFSPEVVAAIEAMRKAHPGWGALTILLELGKDLRFAGQALPSRSRIGAFIKAQQLARSYRHHNDLTEPEEQSVERPHQEWEIDAQGVISVSGLGNVSIINIEDIHTHVKVGSLACLHKTHTNTSEHQLVFRQAFCRYGLPEQVSLDHDSVFYDNRCPSPFPTLLHLWLIALGIQVRFIHLPPPAEHARIERTHQTITQQAVTGQTFRDVAELQGQLDRRVHFLNWDYPCRSLEGQSPLNAFPQAQTTRRPYRLEWEKQLLDLQPVYDYLSQGRWFRSVSPQGVFSLGDQRYSVTTRYALQELEITFCPETCELVCLPQSPPKTFRLKVKKLTKEVLMGELDPLVTFPVYQLALPFSPQTWYQMALCCLMSDTT